jgi:formylglycine-generating enzyme required for sulfatase activity
MHLPPPGEFHADTTRLVQMLRKGHHGVAMDAEAWDRLATWIDLGAPAHGTWTDICGPDRVRHQAERRREMRRRFTGMDEDPEATGDVESSKFQVASFKLAESTEGDEPIVARPAVAKATGETRAVDLGGGITLDLVRVPAGEFVMGQGDGAADERPCAVVKVARDVWIGRCEVSNEQFARFDPAHESGLEFGDYIHFSPGERGWSLSRPRQPVVRVTWHKAQAFCEWLSAKTGRRFRLPSEAEWEYACRAGTATPFWYGAADSDFAGVANLSDRTHQAIDPFGWSGRPAVIPPWRPAATRFDDHARVAVTIGSFEANPWGLHDMHGNVAEWTGTAYRSYPYAAADGRESPGPGERIVTRGGSWYDVPARARSAFRQPYAPDRAVYDVGFRVVCEMER